MKQTLLIIGAGEEACEGIKIARKMSISLVIADGNPQAPGLAMADYKLIVSTYDYKQMLKDVLELENSGVIINGVIAMCADVPMTVARIALKFKLPGLSIDSAMWVSDKILMKQRLLEKGIPIPKFCQVESDTDFEELVSEVGMPFVIKPVDSRGARGVQIVESENQFSHAFFVAQNESPTSRVMVEEYLLGPQVSTETLIDNNKCYTIGFCDRNYEWLQKTKPFIIENGGDAPTSLTSEQQQDVTSTVEAAAQALNINCGVAKGDMVLTGDGAKVIEIAGRLSGGYFSTTQILLATGVNFVREAISLALGESLQKERIAIKYQKGVAIRYLDLKPGTIKTIKGIKRASQLRGVIKLSVHIEAGDNIPTLNSHVQRAGFVITQAETKKQAIQCARDALKTIKITYI